MERLCLGHSDRDQQSLKQMVLGTITYRGTGIMVFVDGNMNTQKYMSVGL